MRGLGLGVLVVAIVGSLASAALTGCGATASKSTVAVAAGAPLEGRATEVDRSLAQPVNRFGFELLGEAVKGDEGSASTVVSPASVAVALTMVLNGAEGETATEMRRVLGIDGEDVGRANRAWANVISRTSEESQSLRIANSLWVDQGAPVAEDFLVINRDYFGAEVRTLDLQALGAPDAINDWVSQKTGGTIDELVREIDSDDILELVNAVYFKGGWEFPFDESATVDADFTLANGRKLSVPLMEAHRRMEYSELDGGTQMVRVPYLGDLSMYVILPSRAYERPEDFLPALATSGLPEQMEERPGSLWLPRFEARSRNSLSGELRALGMDRAFDEARAEFGGIIDALGPVWISQVNHEVYVATDEGGTEAAAATQVGVEALAAVTEPVTPFEMRVDRPFVFAITDDRSGLVLFAGVVRDPRSGQ